VNPDGFVIDTSALLTLIEDEDGAERVDQVLRSERVWIPWLVLLELNYITRQERGETEADRRYALMKQLPVTILWSVDEPTLLTAARIKASYHLSLADAVIAAVAMQMNATLLHKDPEFEVLTGQLCPEALPYK
jgi:predicted nucleic acid-binding protein